MFLVGLAEIMAFPPGEQLVFVLLHYLDACFCKWGVSFVGVLIVRVLPFWVRLGPLIFRSSLKRILQDVSKQESMSTRSPAP